ncbi:UNC93-like protein MFSD11 [Chironomus tepperi]|uniref:UNC93-like protein MFSD11 n=1 Tax=Chironomus tepperi TaxID=113505 RepID=UPI00391FA860
MDARFINILILGFGFMFLFTAFQTMGNIEKTVLDSITADDPNFTGDGYISLAIIYGVFAICNWIAPPVISLTGPRCAMLIGAVAYCGFMVSFLWPQTWLLYTVSAVLGVGAAIIWTAQGAFLSRCSDETTISRNSGIFWAMLQMSMFFGNLFVYFQFQGKTHIDEATRTLVFSVLIGVGVLGFIFLTALRPAHDTSVRHASDIETDDELETTSSTVVVAFKNSINLFFTKEMLLLCLTFFYTGLELSFFSGVYSPSIGFTTQIGESAKQLVGLSGICIGMGEVFGGIAFGLLGARTSTKLGRDPIVILGFIIHIIAFFLIFLNLPNAANLGDTKDVAYLNPPLASVALLCSFLLGFGDSCYNTQIYSLLGGTFAKKSTEAFSIFKFVQSVAAASSFVYSSHIGLRMQMAILVVFGTIGTIAFYTVEWSQRRKECAEKEMIKSSDDHMMAS